MRLKYYLRGIGIGIFITTILFMISIPIHKEKSVQTEAETEEVTAGTVADLQEKALEEQMTEESEDKKTETQVFDTEVADETDTEVADETDTERLTDTEEVQNGEAESVTIEVVAGEFSDQICVKLKEVGAIEDAWDFNVYLMKIDYDNLIRPGEYEIPKGASYEEIAQILVPGGKKENR